MIRKLAVAVALSAGLTLGAATPALGHVLHVQTPNGCQNLGGQSTHAGNGLHVAQDASARIIPGVCGH